MDANGSYSLSDLAAATGNGGFNGGNDWLAMIFLFALIFGFGNGGLGANGFQNAIGYENLATSNEVQRGFDNQNSMANEREILAAVNGNSLQGMQNANQNTQYLMGAFNDKYNELQRDIAGVAMLQQQGMANQQQCCTDTKMLISETASHLQQAIQAEGAATRAMIQQDKIEALQQKVNDLNMKLQLSDVARVPTFPTYNGGTYPFCSCGCGNI